MVFSVNTYQLQELIDCVQFTDCSALARLQKLQYLGLRENQITCLPCEMAEMGLFLFLDGDTGLVVGGNPLESPPISIIQQGQEAILQYYKSMDKGNS